MNLSNSNEEFNGKILWCQTGSDSQGNNWTMTSIDQNWQRTPFQRIDHAVRQKLPPAQKDFSTMIELAKKLSEGINFVRIDFYETDHGIYFGEMTFTPAAGIAVYDPPEWNEKLGDMIKLPKKSEPFNPFK